MLLLVTKAVPTLVRYAHPNLGRLVTPRHYTNLVGMVAAAIPWAADNDGFSGVDEQAFSAMLVALTDLPGCLFVTAPDVLADAETTLAQFDPWASKIRIAGLPVALVGQDGLEHHPVPWDDLDAFFVGGTTGWKLSPEAAALVAEANRRGKWTHMGRVNSHRRIEYAKAIGCRSVDGSKFAQFTDTWLPDGLAAVGAPTQLQLGASA